MGASPHELRNLILRVVQWLGAGHRDIQAYIYEQRLY